MAGYQQAVSDDDLQAYVDNRLNRVKSAAVEKYLYEHPVVKTELREYQLMNRAFHHMFDAVKDEAVPKRLVNFDQFNTQKSAGDKRRLPFAQAAVVVVALIVGAASGWLLRGELTPPGAAREVAGDSTVTMVRDAFSYHAVYTPEIKHPVEVPASEHDHLVKWLSKRLKTAVVAPDLGAQGFELLGGRLLSSGNLPAAQFMYENTKGRRMTLFTRKRKGDEADSAFRFASKGKVNGFYWTDSELSLVLIADISKDEMSNLAHVVYEKLNK